LGERIREVIELGRAVPRARRLKGAARQIATADREATKDPEAVRKGLEDPGYGVTDQEDDGFVESFSRGVTQGRVLERNDWDE
jgi:hypothetical protein